MGSQQSKPDSQAVKMNLPASIRNDELEQAETTVRYSLPGQNEHPHGFAGQAISFPEELPERPPRPPRTRRFSLPGVRKKSSAKESTPCTTLAEHEPVTLGGTQMPFLSSHFSRIKRTRSNVHDNVVTGSPISALSQPCGRFSSSDLSRNPRNSAFPGQGDPTQFEGPKPNSMRFSSRSELLASPSTLTPTFAHHSATPIQPIIHRLTEKVPMQASFTGRIDSTSGGSPATSPSILPQTLRTNTSQTDNIMDEAHLSASGTAHESAPLGSRSEQKHNRRTITADAIAFEEIKSTPHSNGQISYPELRAPHKDCFVENGRRISQDLEKTISHQEVLDREIARQLQSEEDFAYCHGMANSIESTEMPTPRASARRAIFNRYLTRWKRASGSGNPQIGSCLHNSSDSLLVNLDDDTHIDARSILKTHVDSQDDSIMLTSSQSYGHMNQEYEDSLLAIQIHLEEQERMQKEATRECVVCATAVPIHKMPTLIACAHEPEICSGCFARWIDSELGIKPWNELSCPGTGCKIILQHHNVQQYASAKTYENALNEEPDFRWCRAPGCHSGQIHDGGTDGNIFRCVACGHRVCVIHEGNWHEGETCEEFDYRTSGRQEQDRKRQEEASVKAIGKLAKKCPGPNCAYNIEKNDGCDHMTCSRCRYQFCWICLADYGKIRAKGNSAHKKNCRYHSNRLPS